jgi:glycosyltransferase involved in cell wall biosynthesis
MHETVSVLMPVHAGIDPAHLARALESIAEQTRTPDEVVLVEDGPLSRAHHAAIAAAEPGLPSMITLVLPTNQGAGIANQTGLLRCTGVWIMKADADDISAPHRLERELSHAAETGAGVVGSAMLEFQGAESNVLSVRTPPLTHEEIVRRMRWNNPMNHPTTLYRADIAKEAGGYGDLRFMQDYDLFARLLSRGARFSNLEEPLVRFRAGDAVFARRRSGAMRRCEWQLQRNLRRYGVIGPFRRYANFFLRQGARTIPAPVMARLHRALFSRAWRERGTE